MDEGNIYDDLDDFILEHRVGQVQENNKDLQQTIEKLEETTKKFNEEISSIKQIKQNLERNISSLFKTAKNEIQRKDKKIAELNRELDDLRFKRANKKPEKPDKDIRLIKEIETTKCVIEQKNRIIQSLTKELENVKKDYSLHDNRVNRKSSHVEEDLRSRLGKKRKLDDTKSEYKSRRPRSPRSRSRSKSRYDRRRNHSNGGDKYKQQRYSRSRSPPRQKPEERDRHRHEEPKKSRSPRSSSIDRKKHEIIDKKTKCEPKLLHNHLIKEDSGMSSSNSQTSELIVKNEEIKIPDTKDDLEEGEIDCSLEDIQSEEENYSKEKPTCEPDEMKPSISEEKTLENPNPKEDVLELMVQNNYLDDLDIDEEITKMRMAEDDKRKKRKEDKAKISKLRNAISECKQNIELLEHRISSDEETETEDDFNKAGVLEENSVNNLVLKISKGSIVHSQQNNEESIESNKENVKSNEEQVINDTFNKTDNTEPVNKIVETTVLKTVITDIFDEGSDKIATTNDDSTENNLRSVENLSEQNDIDKQSMSIVKDADVETERKAPLKAKRRRAFICIT